MDRKDLIQIAITALRSGLDAGAAIIDAVIESDMRDEDGDLVTDTDGYVDEIESIARSAISQSDRYAD